MERLKNGLLIRACMINEYLLPVAVRLNNNRIISLVVQNILEEENSYATLDGPEFKMSDLIPDEWFLGSLIAKHDFQLITKITNREMPVFDNTISFSEIKILEELLIP